MFGGDQDNGGFDPFVGESELNRVEDESELCDCPTEYKDTQTIPKSAGASIGGIGGQLGSGDTVIVCKNCGKMFDVDDTRESNSGIL